MDVSRAVALGLVLGACIRSSSVTCPNGDLCPAGTICYALSSVGEETCVTRAQLDACSNVADGGSCTFTDAPASACHDGACLPIACGNGYVDPGEVCDDHNTISGDGCSADCKSDETCGNGIVDPVKLVGGVSEPNEQCDDANHVSHDGCSSSCRIETPEWLDVSFGTPPPLDFEAMTYDASRDRVVMFGGAASLSPAFGLSSSTWEWDGTGWQLAAVAFAPPPRRKTALAYDPIRRRVVMFGGDNGNGVAFGDTWTWDGAAWTLLAPPTSPPPRLDHAMTFDPIRGKIVLFGGSRGNDGSNTPLADTWEFDGTTWSPLATATAPAARSRHAMAFDPVRGIVVIVGGNIGTFTAPVSGDSWSLAGSTWTQLAGGPPSAIAIAAAFDPIARRILTFGGNDAAGNVSAETWMWDGAAWARVATTGPSARSGATAALDGGRGMVLLYGGVATNVPQKDTWQWTGEAWSSVTIAPVTPPAFAEIASAYDALRGRMIVFGGYIPTTNSYSNQTWILDRGRWSTVGGTAPPARSYSAMAYDPLADRAVLFGGWNTGGTSRQIFNDTWIFDGATWSQANPATAPSMRLEHAMSYDLAAKRVVLYGGVDTISPTALTDTWEWDGANWTERDSNGPPGMFDAMMTYDPIRQRVVMIGISPTLAFSMWAWDHSAGTWSEIVPTRPPNTRFSGGATWNAARGSLVEFGGDQQALILADTWESRGNEWDPVPVPPPHPRSAYAMTQTRDGAGAQVFAGFVDSSGTAVNDVSELRWSGGGPYETCFAHVDIDGDGLAGCDDPDCWSVCRPLCPPGAPCDPAWPHCGDGTCNTALESCRSCPSDCGACTAVCGDSYCDPPETAATCPGDCR
jgi:cysteine-rich repeat protein